MDCTESPTSTCKLLCPGMIDLDYCTPDELKAFLQDDQQPMVGDIPDIIVEDTRVEVVYGIQPIAGLLDDPDFEFLDEFDPDSVTAMQDVRPLVSTSGSVKTSKKVVSPLDYHVEYCGPYAKHSKHNCWEVQPWLMPIGMVEKRAKAEWRDNYDKPVDERSYRWSDILDRKREAGEMDSIEKQRLELLEYERHVLEKADEVEKKKYGCRSGKTK